MNESNKNRLLAFNLVLVLVLSAFSPLSAQEQGKQDRCEQKYTSWKRHPTGKYYYCRYFFKSQPGGSRQEQIVVWFPEKKYRGFTFYFNKDSVVYWCRALNHLHNDYKAEQNRWQVLSKGKSRDISKIVTWPDDFSEPNVPGAAKQDKMLPPPKPPLSTAQLAEMDKKKAN